jgi:hypothetical protein
MTLIVKKQQEPSEPTLEERREHQSWCFKNGIIIYFKPINWREGKIVVDNNGQILEGTVIYYQSKLKPKDEKYWEIIWKLYTKYFIENTR